MIQSYAQRIYMPKSRNIKFSFFSNEILSCLPPLTRIFFIGLWGLSDRNGIVEFRPKKIEAEIFPYEDVDIQQMVLELGTTEFIHVYQVGKNQYIQILNFKKHQKPHQKEKALYPLPEEKNTSSVKIPGSSGNNSGSSALNVERLMLNDECGLLNVDSRDSEKSRTPVKEKESSIFDRQMNEAPSSFMKPFPEGFEPTKNHKQIAEGYGLDVRLEIEKCKSSCLERGKLSYDWNASFSSWLHRAKNFQRKPKELNHVSAVGSQRRKSSAEIFWEHHATVFGDESAEAAEKGNG